LSIPVDFDAPLGSNVKVHVVFSLARGAAGDLGT